MLNFRDIRLRRGAEPLIEAASFSVFRGEKLGVVGRNGSGKSTLLALIRGELTPDAGEYEVPEALKIVSVLQQVPHTEQAVIDYVIDGDEELRSLEREIGLSRDAGDGMREATLLGEFDHLGGYTARSRAASLLDGLGFDADAIDRPMNQFSGGLRMRANMARALMRRSDLLLLDEPTNHLDLDAVLWLESWLSAYPGTLLLVSHDREFLDAIVGRVLHIEDRKITLYSGNYSEFEVQHAAQRAQTAATAARLRREAAHIQSFVDRFRAKASKAKQAQSRLKWLERLPQVVEARDAEHFEWEFQQPRKLPRPLVALDDVAAGYGAHLVIDQVKLSVGPETRLGVLGRNGAGKSTLMRILAGEAAPLSGTSTVSPDLVPGFFAQLEVDQLDAQASALLELKRRGGSEVAAWSEQQRRDHLGRFGFRGERVFEPIVRFSGGERARLSLAILVARRPNLLLLDEPTNHLDFEMRHALLLALQEFAGAVVIVSHDRALLRGVCDEFVLVGRQRVTGFDGDLEDYASWLGRERNAASSAPRPAPSPRAAAAATGPSKRTRERRVAALQAQLAEVEMALEALHARRAELERRLADPELYASRPLAEQREVTDSHALASQELASLETRWLEISEQLQ